jgi:hypothetical protein
MYKNTKVRILCYWHKAGILDVDRINYINQSGNLFTIIIPKKLGRPLPENTPPVVRRYAGAYRNFHGNVVTPNMVGCQEIVLGDTVIKEDEQIKLS